MNEEIIKVLDELGKRFGIAIDWTSQNVMPYLQDLMGRFIAYRNAQAVIWIVISIISIILSILGIKKLFKWKKENEIKEYDDDWGVFLLAIIGLICALCIFIIVLFCNIQGLVQNIFIPELSIMDYLKGQI